MPEWKENKTESAKRGGGKVRRKLWGKIRYSTVDGPDYSPEELDFFRAIERWMSLTGNRYPSFDQVLAIAISRGWRKVQNP